MNFDLLRLGENDIFMIAPQDFFTLDRLELLSGAVMIIDGVVVTRDTICNGILSGTGVLRVHYTSRPVGGLIGAELTIEYYGEEFTQYGRIFSCRSFLKKIFRRIIYPKHIYR